MKKMARFALAMVLFGAAIGLGSPTPSDAACQCRKNSDCPPSCGYCLGAPCGRCAC